MVKSMIMYRLIRYILFINIILGICVNSSAQDDPIKVELQANKKEFIFGEPVLLKTSVINTSENPYVLNEAGYQWGQAGFTMSIAYNDEDYVDFFNIDIRRKLDIIGSMLGGYVYQPRYVRSFIPPSLEGKQQAEITDIFMIPKPGEYKFKSVLKDYAGNVKPYESEPVSFKVLPLSESKDSIFQIDDSKSLPMKFTRTLHSVHYFGRIGDKATPDYPLGLEGFEKIASEIINNHKDSVFREYVLYADIMAHGEQRSSYHPLPEKYKQEAYDFAKEYPDSWLLPFVYLKLGDTFIYEKDLDKADEYVEKSQELAPNASFIGAGKGHERIDIIRQQLGNTSVAQAQPEKPDGDVLALVGVTIAVMVITVLLLFLEKSPVKNEKK